MNIKNGHVLCILTPYDPNKIVKANKEYWNSLLTNNLSPLTFRCVLAYIHLALLLNDSSYS